MSCFDTALLDRYQAGVDADYEQQEAKEIAIERAGEMLARKADGLTPSEWYSKKLSGGSSLNDMLTDAMGSDTEVDTLLAQLCMCDHTFAVRLRNRLLQMEAERNYLNLA